jgi:hypothetical protein
MRRVIGLFIAALATTACSDSTGPTGLAHHLDTLYRQACARAYTPAVGLGNGAVYDTASVYWQRCRLLSVLLAGPASGAEPSAVRVTTANGVETWHGLVILEYDTVYTGTPETNFYVLIAYSDANVTNAVVSFLGYDATYIVANDTVTVNGTTLSDSGSRVSVGVPCHDTPGLVNPLANPLTGFPPIEYSGAICRLATFEASLSSTFPATPGLDASLQAIAIDRQSIAGISVIPSYFWVNRVMTTIAR